RSSDLDGQREPRRKVGELDQRALQIDERLPVGPPVGELDARIAEGEGQSFLQLARRGCLAKFEDEAAHRGLAVCASRLRSSPARKANGRARIPTWATPYATCCTLRVACAMPATSTAMNRQASAAPIISTGAKVRRAGGVALNQRPMSSLRPTTVTPASMTSCRPLRLVEVAGLWNIWAAL